MEISDKVALVTGGASGIGRASAARLRAEGARVIIADIDRALGAACAAQLGVHFEPLDVSDASAWDALTRAICDAHGGLDIVHLNAGLLTPRSGQKGAILGGFDLGTMGDDDYRAVTSVNIDGVVFGARAAVRAMAGRGGAIVATASVAALLPFANDPIYAMTKHAVLGLVRSLGPALEPQRITINAICPAIVRTAIAETASFDTLKELGVGVMDPSQIAEAVVQAISSGATGQALVCVPNHAPQIQSFPEIDITGAS
ncbi:MAG: SDR family NAD(P)-dependent oxidoreductase [Myxococcales bacterium]|nr:SDR family NAD(P)-dependent oxidoreductase [Myxococcales bacterium]